MFSAFFGHYLLNKGVVTATQLSTVLEKQGQVRLKLGTLAINDGFMNATQVDEVHELQAAMDKRFGEIAIDKGYLVDAQLMHLLKQQKAENLILAQALIDDNIMSMIDFEREISAYKEAHSLSDEQFGALKEGNVDIAIKAFLAFEKDDENQYDQYLSLFLKNVIRFIDSNVSVDRVKKVSSVSLKNAFYQHIKDDKHNYITAISGEEDVILGFAGRYADEAFTEMGDYPIDALGEFLNLHNGLFIVNMSNEGTEMELTVQEFGFDHTIKSASNLYQIPLYTTYGTLNLIVGQL
ncbi:MAG: hypothetical protein PF505_05800 [Vallitaleaceae bacterium]|jgi:hypothetical protein|nr:hypothetical protein [Vallitaleaceae bacterium]